MLDWGARTASRSVISGVSSSPGQGPPGVRFARRNREQLIGMSGASARERGGPFLQATEESAMARSACE